MKDSEAIRASKSREKKCLHLFGLQLTLIWTSRTFLMDTHFPRDESIYVIYFFLYMYISEDSFNMMWCKHKIMFDIDDISVYAVYVYGYMA